MGFLSVEILRLARWKKSYATESLWASIAPARIAGRYKGCLL